MLVLTSDVLYELFTEDPASGQVREKVRERFKVADGRFCAPPQMEWEVFSALRGRYKTDRLSAEQLADRMEALGKIPYKIVQVSLLFDYVLGFDRYVLSLSDGLYIATALRMQAPLLTVRPDLAAQAQRCRAEASLIS